MLVSATQRRPQSSPSRLGQRNEDDRTMPHWGTAKPLSIGSRHRCASVDSDATSTTALPQPLAGAGSDTSGLRSERRLTETPRDRSRLVHVYIPPQLVSMQRLHLLCPSHPSVCCEGNMPNGFVHSHDADHREHTNGANRHKAGPKQQVV